MANEYCNDCIDLDENAPDFMLNGVTQAVCNSLRNNTGLNPDPTNTNDNCDELATVVNCKIGSFIDKYTKKGECDALQAVLELAHINEEIYYLMLCSMCGLWEGVEALRKILQQLRTINVWNNTTNIFQGDFLSGKGIAGGNINVYGQALGSYIKTNASDTTENSLMGGINVATLSTMESRIAEQHNTIVEMQEKINELEKSKEGV